MKTMHYLIDGTWVEYYVVVKYLLHNCVIRTSSESAHTFCGMLADS